MLDESFLESFLNQPHKVLGRKLLPYSLWHRVLLEVFKSPIVSEDQNQDINYADLELAVRVCTLRFEETLAVPRFAKLRLLIGALRVRSVKVEAIKFGAYLADYLAPPDFWQEKKMGGGKGGPPEPCSTVTALMLLGFGEREAWEMPIGKAYWYSSTYHSVKGADLDFVTERDKAFQRKLKKDQGEKEQEKKDGR